MAAPCKASASTLLRMHVLSREMISPQAKQSWFCLYAGRKGRSRSKIHGHTLRYMCFIVFPYIVGGIAGISWNQQFGGHSKGCCNVSQRWLCALANLTRTLDICWYILVAESVQASVRSRPSPVAACMGGYESVC